MNLTIAAVGSSSLIAGEIKEILTSLLSNRFNLITSETKTITDDTLADIYVCAQTQYTALLKHIPADRVFLFDLTPASTFFLDISRIPSGSIVYIFNNRLAYPQALTTYCQSLGINNVDFQPIAFEEMPQSEVTALLKKAKYIIGVDRFLSENVLLAEPYKSALHSDVKIISGKRTASLSSSFKILLGITKWLLKNSRSQYQSLLDSPTNTLGFSELLADLEEIIDIIQAAAIQSVVNQANIQTTKADTELPTDYTTGSLAEIKLAIENNLHTIELLQEKLDHLAK